MRHRPSLHSPAMMKRIVAALSLATCVVACLDKSTSLGGPEGNQASATSSLDASAEAESPPSAPDAGDAAVSADAAVDCFWHEWMPGKAVDACTYLLPPSDPPSHGSPYFDCRSSLWNPAKVYAATWVTHPPSSEVDGLIEALYVDGPASCPAEGGWYYDETSVGEDGHHARYVLCPTTCTRANAPNAEFFLWATYCKELR